MRSRKEEQRQREERLPPAETPITAMVVNPELLAKFIDDFYSTKPGEELERDVPEIARDVIEAIRELRSIVMKNQLRYLPQSTISISSKKAFVESSKQLIMSTYSLLEALGEGHIGNIYKGIEILSSPTSTLEERAKAADMIYKSMVFLIACLYGMPLIIKDLTGVVELSMPFHLASDLVKKNIGYTATQ